MTVPPRPNATAVHVRVLTTEMAADGWGAWADVEVLDSAPAVATQRSFELTGRRMRVFVPPLLVEDVARSEVFEGELVLRGGPGQAVYGLRRRGS
jgi:hypothetical protein